MTPFGLHKSSILAVVGFAPTNYSGLKLWLDASDTSTITLNGSDVSQWDDKSGTGNHATQGTAANQPEYVTSAQNGLNGVRFDGVAEHMVTTNTLTTTDETVVIVANYDSGATGDRSPLGADIQGYSLRDRGGTMEWIVTGFTEGVDALRNTTPDWGTTATVVTGFRSQTDNIMTLRKDGTQSETTTHTGGNLSGVKMTIGTRSAALELWQGDILEIVQYSTRLTLAQILVLESYMSAKWGT
jgi:hypothetical protein